MHTVVTQTENIWAICSTQLSEYQPLGCHCALPKTSWSTKSTVDLGGEMLSKKLVRVQCYYFDLTTLNYWLLNVSLEVFFRLYTVRHWFTTQQHIPQVKSLRKCFMLLKVPYNSQSYRPVSNLQVIAKSHFLWGYWAMASGRADLQLLGMEMFGKLLTEMLGSLPFSWHPGAFWGTELFPLHSCRCDYLTSFID